MRGVKKQIKNSVCLTLLSKYTIIPLNQGVPFFVGMNALGAR